jgi:hypothetical protein
MLPVESFELRPSNQYILMRVIRSCFRFVKICFAPDKSPVKVQLEILDIFFLGELHIVYMDRGARFLSYGESDVYQFGSVSFHSPFSKPVSDCS